MIFNVKILTRYFYCPPTSNKSVGSQFGLATFSELHSFMWLVGATLDILGLDKRQLGGSGFWIKIVAMWVERGQRA